MTPSLSDISTLAANVAAADGPDAVYGLVAEAAGTFIGHRLCTILLFHETTMQVRRQYSSNPDAYPPGGFKDKLDTEWGRQVLEEGRPYIGYNADDIRTHFKDHDVIFSLGLESILNMPVRLHGRILGTINLLHEANYYSEAHVPVAGILAGHLAATLNLVE
jgi:GAF domain-containing protein